MWVITIFFDFGCLENQLGKVNGLFLFEYFPNDYNLGEASTVKDEENVSVVHPN